MACGSGTVVTDVFYAPQDALAWLRFTAIPFILAFDVAPERDGPPKPAEHYLPHYRAQNKTDLAGLLRLLDENMVKPKVDRKTMNSIVHEYSYVFHGTNPCSEIVAHGQTMDFLCSPVVQEEIAQALEDEEDREVHKFAGLIKARAIDFDNPAQSELLFNLLERLNKF